MNWVFVSSNRRSSGLFGLKGLICVTLGLTFWFFSQTLVSAQMYSIETLGLTDADHTRSDNYRFSWIESTSERFNTAGQVIGQSYRYSGTTYRGVSAWLHSGGVSTNIGLNGAEHTRSDNYRFSWAGRLNAVGQVIGTSTRYSGSSDLGQSAWIYSGGVTTIIGLTNAEHTRSDNYRQSTARDLNTSGHVIGNSSRYSGTNDRGQSAWLYSGGATSSIGLTGAEHTRNDNYRDSSADNINSAGQVIGHSQRYSGTSYLGQSAWLHSGGITTNIGLNGAEHTRSDNYRLSWIGQLNSAGQVIGTSHRYSGSSELGQSAWLHSGGVTTNIGLTDAEHTRSDNFRHSIAKNLNSSGHVIGDSRRYSGTSDRGISAWLHRGGVTTNIGLTGAEHTRSDNFRDSIARNINSSGHVIGNSSRYSGTSYLGASAWLYSGGVTSEIGLFDGNHVGRDGYRYTQASMLNESGQVVGFSSRYDANGLQHYGYLNKRAQTSWLHDLNSGQTYSLLLSVQASRNFAYSEVNYLGDDGLVLGIYHLYDSDSFFVGERPFMFTIATGAQDLGLTIDGSFADWSYLARAVRANSLGTIIGNGVLKDGSSMAFKLTPNAVPEPSSLLLVGIGIAAWAWPRRTRRVRLSC